MGIIINQRSTEKIFLFNNEYISGTFNNNTGDVLQLVGGELIGRDSTTDKLVILTAAGANGANIPLGINRSCYVDLADGLDVTMYVCISGGVSQSKVILSGAETLETVVSGRRLKDRIIGDTAGIRLDELTELTDYDND